MPSSAEIISRKRLSHDLDQGTLAYEVHTLWLTDLDPDQDIYCMMLASMFSTSCSTSDEHSSGAGSGQHEQHSKTDSKD